MISKDKITTLVQKAIEKKDGFYLVEVKVSATNSIKVFIDNDKNISISDCVDISRFIEKNMDREIEDYELEVSSPGMDQPFKVFQQYEKAIGRKVKVIEKDGKETEGILKSAIEGAIEVEVEAKKKNKKQEAEPTKTVNILISNIKETKKTITFK